MAELPKDAQSLLLEGIERLDVGLTVFDRELNLVAANRAFAQMLNFPEALCQPGTPLEQSLLYNATQGEYGAGDPQSQVQERLTLARQFLPHRFERVRPDGQVIQVHGYPLQGGGMVTTYTDVTLARRREEELRALTEELAERVEERSATLRQREGELAHKARLLETVVSHINQGITFFNSDLELEITNQRCLDLLQMPPELGRPGTHFEALARFNAERGEYGPGDVESLVKERVQAAGLKVAHRLERTRPDGTVLEIIGTPTADGAMVSTYQDVTARNEAEARLRQSQQQIDLALSGTNMGLWYWHFPTRSFTHKVVASKVLGYELGEFELTEAFFDSVMHPDDRQPFAAALRRHVRDGAEMFENEHRVRHKDGHWQWSLVRGKVVERDAAGRAVRMIGTYADVTERKQGELTLQAQQIKLQNIIAGTNAGTWECDLVTGMLVVNQRYADILGRPMDEVQGKFFEVMLRLSHPDDLPGLQAVFLRTVKSNEQFYQCEFRMRHAQGKWIWVAALGNVHSRSETGRALMMSGIQMDITERKEGEARIRELNETLEQRVQERSAELNAALSRLHHSQEELARTEARATRSTLVASVTHELATPLGNTLMTASTLTEQARAFASKFEKGQLTRADLSDFVNSVRVGGDLVVRNLHRADELVKNFKQVAADQASEQRRKFDLAETVQEVLEILGPSLKKKPHEVVTDIAHGMVMDSFPGPVGQVVINLINNCYLHAFDDGAAGVVSISAVRAGDQIRLTVADNGTGMSAEHLKQLFRPYFSTKIGQGGTGLGMTIVENLVYKTLGGSIDVRSQIGKGTEFILLLPVSAPQLHEDKAAP